MGDMNLFIEELKKNLLELASGSFHKYSSQLIKDGTDFALKLEDDLKKWAAEYSIHEMTKEEFESQVKSKKNLLKMESLKHEGLAKTDLNKLRNAIVETVTDTATMYLLK
ncbi:MAG TPA: hypothetical protein VLB50_05650 [Ignavibacteriaceae bacterium]|nr:hypothetical protein [Ignavibacteriaceae bacterium]